MTTTKTWLSIVGATPFVLFAVVAAAGSPDAGSTIMQNGAPIVIDRCAVTLNRVAEAGRSNPLSDNVGFTNVSQRTVTRIRFEFDIVDSAGETARAVTSDKSGSFGPGMAVEGPEASQKAEAFPSGIQLLCRVQTVRFDDGSTWHEGDEPAGNNATFFTPLPGPTPTVQWQWPYDTPVP